MQLTRDARLLFIARFTRLFAYGALSVVLVFYLTGLGLSESQTGLLFTLTLAGDTVISLFLSSVADRIGRRRMLIAGSLLMIGAGLAFAFSANFWFLVIAGTIGVISPSGNEVGPFLPIEQAALSQTIGEEARTKVFAWYTLTGSFATALGSLFGGFLPGAIHIGTLDSYRAVVILYAGLGVLLALVFLQLSSSSEVDSDHRQTPVSRPSQALGLGPSRGVILKLSALFSLDAFGGGFVVQSFAAYWFYLRYGLDPAALGAVFFGANVLAGISALIASRLATRFGLVRTMVFTHLPSNILLFLVPVMPTLPLAISALLLRFSISQMDVPARQAYVMAVVRPEERSAAAGITGVARTLGASIAPWFAGMLFAQPALINFPFFAAGLLKSIYDLLLFKEFASLPPSSESPRLPK